MVANRLNVNRGFMKLEVWNEAMALFGFVYKTLEESPPIDLRLKSQLLGAAQSVSSNIAEGYCRRTVNEYLQFLNIALGSLGEVMTRMIGLRSVGIISIELFDQFDRTHYSLENKMISLVKSLQAKRRLGQWQEEF